MQAKDLINLQELENPYMALGAAVCGQAREELQSRSLIKALEALAWWLQDAPAWMGMLDLDDNPDLIFRRLLEV